MWDWLKINRSLQVHDNKTKISAGTTVRLIEFFDNSWATWRRGRRQRLVRSVQRFGPFKKALVDSKIKTKEKQRMLLVSSLKRCVDFIGLECLEGFGWSTPVNVPPWGVSVSASLKEDRMFMGVRIRRSPRSFVLWKQKIWDWFKFPPFCEQTEQKHEPRPTPRCNPSRSQPKRP